MTEKEIQEHPDKKRYCFYSESEEVTQEWFSFPTTFAVFPPAFTEG